MNKNHFNIHEFRKILALAETDPVTANVLYEEYFKKYPEDYSARTFYCVNLITLGEFELAEKVLKRTEEEYKNDPLLMEESKLEKIEYSIFFAKIKLLSYQGKYEELHKLCVKNINRVVNSSLNKVWFYAKKELVN